MEFSVASDIINIVGSPIAIFFMVRAWILADRARKSSELLVDGLLLWEARLNEFTDIIDHELGGRVSAKLRHRRDLIWQAYDELLAKCPWAKPIGDRMEAERARRQGEAHISPRDNAH